MFPKTGVLCDLTHFKKSQDLKIFKRYLDGLPDSAFVPKDGDSAPVRLKAQKKGTASTDNIWHLAKFRRNKKDSIGFVIRTTETSERG